MPLNLQLSILVLLLSGTGGEEFLFRPWKPYEQPTITCWAQLVVVEDVPAHVAFQVVRCSVAQLLLNQDYCKP